MVFKKINKNRFRCFTLGIFQLIKVTIQIIVINIIILKQIKFMLRTFKTIHDDSIYFSLVILTSDLVILC